MLHRNNLEEMLMMGNPVKLFLTSDLPPSYSEVMLDPVKFPSYLPTVTAPPPPYPYVANKSYPRVLTMITEEGETEEQPGDDSCSLEQLPAALLLLSLACVGGLVIPQMVVGVLDIACDNNATPVWLLFSSIMWSLILVIGNIIIIVANYRNFTEFVILSNISLFILWVYGCGVVYEVICAGLFECPTSLYLCLGYIMAQATVYVLVLAGLMLKGFT